VRIAHDFAETYGGAERIAATIADAFPDAHFHTILGRQNVARRMGVEGRFSSLLPERSFVLRHYRALAPAYPLLVRARPLPEADVLVTSSYAFAHGFRTKNGAPQLCYCYSPLRFAWMMTTDYGRELGLGRFGVRALATLAAPMRALDRRAADGVTEYIAESAFVAAQIEQFYGRRAEVLYPPVDVERFRPASDLAFDDYFLFCGRLVEPYKRPTLAVEAFRNLPHRLVIAGDGPALPQIRALAGPNVEFVGHLDDDDLVPLMQRCAAAIFPSRDDFGLIPVEVMACGRPVIAYAAGGALETVVPGTTGELFANQDARSLREAVAGFDPASYEPAAIRRHAEAWAVPRFQTRIAAAAEALRARG
jgi:glycosyltransferase involved in cell wall biosynthesis